jgi:HAE1 family hydrophobic/amphiphilic exporter-1
VVVEAVHAKLEGSNVTPKEATIGAMSEITGAIISITLIMTAVFVPVAFLPGSAGVFYKQFALTLAIAILISAINALTLSPALCALILKPHAHEKKGKLNFIKKFFGAFNAAFDSLTNKYKNSVKFLSGKKILALIIIILFSAGSYFLSQTIQTGFIPSEDTGVIFADISLPQNSTRERTEKVLEEVDKAASENDLIVSRLYVAGTSLISGVSSGAYGLMVLKLKPWNERKKEGQSVDDIIKDLYARTSNIRDGAVIFFAPPTVPGFGSTDGFELKIKDNTGGTVQNLDNVTQEFLAELNKRNELEYAVTSFSTNFPQYMLDVDVAKCKQTGVEVDQLFQTLQGYIGGIYSSDFNRYGKLYRIMIQAEAGYRKEPASLAGLFTKNDKGEMVPVSALVTLKKVYGPESISRYNLSNAVSVFGKSNTGFSSGDAIKAVEETAKNYLPVGFTYEWTGMTRDELSSAGQAPLVFGLVIIFVFLLLSAQYESYILPFAVLLCVPIGIFGAFLFIKIFDIENNIYFQLALIMLVGLLAKNAILIIEFAVQRRSHGMSITESAISGAVARLRPILMTSFAFIFGLIPLAIASGAGAIGNQSIGTGAIGGMLVGTLVGVFFIPVLFIIFQTLQEKVSGSPVFKIDNTEKKILPELD